MKSRASITRKWTLADEETLGASGIDDAERRRRSERARRMERRRVAAQVVKR